MGCGIRILAHPYSGKSLLNTGDHLLRRYAKVFKTKGYVFLDDRCDDLIIRVLEDHTGAAADLPNIFFLPCVIAADDHISV